MVAIERHPHARPLSRRAARGRIAAADDPEEVTGEPWWRELVQEAVFWTDRGEFWYNEGNIFVNDHDEFHRLFRDHPEVAPLIAGQFEAGRMALSNLTVFLAAFLAPLVQHFDSGVR